MVGWEHNCDTQTGYSSMFNMILQDRTRSDNPFTWYDEVKQRYDYFLPENKKITKVTIYYDYIIYGFRFHLSDGSDWGIGCVANYISNTVTVDIADNEVIVGFKAKSDSDCPARYVEWQFITAKFIKFD